MALAPFNMMFDPFFGGFGPHRELRAGNRAMDAFTSALIPAFELPVQQGPSTAMVSAAGNTPMCKLREAGANVNQIHVEN
jgi:hypothetical protein